jgi:hypothetical protein
MYVLTPDFAAPEQLRGEAVSTTTDVYALGVLLYILLTGKRPHYLRGKSPAEMERIALEQEPARPSSLVGPALRRRLRGDVDAIVMKALRPEPARRYATVAELRDDLLRERAGVPVLARPTGAGYRLRKFASRNRAVVAAGLVTLLALVGATTFSAAQMREAQRQRDAAQVDLKRQQAMSELQSVLTSDSRGVDGRPLTALARIALAERVVMRRFAAEPWLMLELLAELSTRMYEFGDRPTQRRMLDRALAIARRADLPAQRALIECQRAYSFTFDDQFDSARTILARAHAQLARVRDHSLSTEGYCSQAEAQLLVAQNRSDEAITLLTRSLARLPAGNASLRQGTLFELANALRAAGRSRESAVYHRQIVDELVVAGYNGTDILANEFSWLASVLNDLGELATLDSLTRALIREQTDVQHIYSSGVMDFHVGQAQLRMGNADTAEVWLARAQRDTTEGAGGLIA